MQWNKRNQHIKLILILVAIFIAAFFLIFSHYLTINLKQEARAKMNVWAEAMRALNQADENTDLRLVLNVINNNTSIPVIVLDDRGEVIQHRNLHLHWANEADSVQHLLKRKEQMLRDGYRIRMAFDKAEHDAEPSVSSQEEEGRGMDILYEDSNTLKSLEFFPYIQLALLTIFILIIVFTLLSLKRAEQNRVWVGLTKETAHQLGTPISSLMAWNEILKDSYPDDPILPELGKDIARLELIAERFSKVGSQPELKEENLNEILWHVVDYISKRTSDKVKISCSLPRTKVMVNICAPLFEWVV